MEKRVGGSEWRQHITRAYLGKMDEVVEGFRVRVRGKMITFWS